MECLSASPSWGHHWIDDLDGDTTADALVAVRDRIRAAEAERLLIAAH